MSIWKLGEQLEVGAAFRMAISVAGASAGKIATQLEFGVLDTGSLQNSKSVVGRRLPGHALGSRDHDEGYVGLRRRINPQCAPLRTECSRSTRCSCWSSQKGQGQEKKNGYPAAGNVPYVIWFREAWPYIQGHRGSTFVIVIPGEVVENRSALDSILQVRRGQHLARYNC